MLLKRKMNALKGFENLLENSRYLSRYCQRESDVGMKKFKKRLSVYTEIRSEIFNFFQPLV